MTMKQKQMAAALAAVDLYLREEAAARASQASAPRPVAEPGVWAMAGRLDMMTMRRLMQTRAIARVR